MICLQCYLPKEVPRWLGDTLSSAALPRTNEAKVSQLEVFMTTLEITNQKPE